MLGYVCYTKAIVIYLVFRIFQNKWHHAARDQKAQLRFLTKSNPWGFEGLRKLRGQVLQDLE